MTTRIGQLMSAPPVTAGVDEHLDTAARRMASAGIGALLVTDGVAPVGILTERDLLRAAAADADVHAERVAAWMTARPDVLGPDETAEAARRTLASHGYRHIPVVEDDVAVGMLSIRDLVMDDTRDGAG